MPSGAKKRKAAKKKKELQANHNQSNSNSHLGHDYPKSQDERESDGDEAGSPASQDHHNHQHPFKEGNGEFEKRDLSPAQSFDSENKSMVEVARGLEGAQKVGVEDGAAVNIVGELTSEDPVCQSNSIKHVELVKESFDGSSSRSSTDNESFVVEKTITKAALQNGENKPVDFFPKEVIQGTEKPSLREIGDTVVETFKPLVTESEEVIHVTQGDSVEISVASNVVDTFKENEESKRNEEKIIPLTEENVGASSNVQDTEPNENEGKILPTSVTPAETSNGGESLRDSQIPDSSVNQPLIASAPRVEQRTSWMSCCGLFDMLTGSNR